MVSNGQPNDIRDAVTQHIRDEIASLEEQREELDNKLRILRDALWHQMLHRP